MRLVPSSIDGLETAMARIELLTYGFGALLLCGVVAEVFSSAVTWQVCVAIGVAGEVTLGLVNVGLARRHRALTAREQKRLSAIIAEANARASEANAAAEALRAENLELQARIQPRQITATAAPVVARAVTPYTGQKFSIFAGASDAEAVVFARRLRRLLVQAGWVPEFNDIAYGAMLALVIGVEIQVGDAPTTVSAGEALREALSVVGVVAYVEPAEDQETSINVLRWPPPDDIRITVGVKPLPEMDEE